VTPETDAAGEAVTEDQSVPFAPDAPDEPTEHTGAEESAEITSPAAERTGHEAVDSVLDSLDALAGTPVAEHVAVFEAAHDRLRGTLATAGDNTPRPQG
jgi:hypothetical protein